MSTLNAIKNSKTFLSFLGKKVTENDHYYGKDKFKTLVFDSVNEKGITFTAGNSTHTFLWQWIKITPNPKDKTFLLSLKNNKTYTILFSL